MNDLARCICTVLIVSDDPLKWVTVKETLDGAGYQTRLCGDQDVTHEFQRQLIHVVLFDLDTRNMPRLKMCLALRQTFGKAIVLIAVIGSGYRNLSVTALFKGVDDCVHSYVSPDELLVRIYARLRRKYFDGEELCMCNPLLAM
jgi:DNA-binding response OmpR family regulator